MFQVLFSEEVAEGEGLEVGDSEIIQSESDGFIDFSELNPFSEGVY